MKQEVVYAVSEGCYSDYSVRCVCLDKAVAEQIAADINADGGSFEEARVEELALFSKRPTKVPYTIMSQTLWDDGSAERSRDVVKHEWPHGWEAPMPRCRWRWVRAPVHNGLGGRLEVRGTDIKRCRKVFSDKKREIRTVDALRIQTEVSGGA